jgi:hypothetical protein
MITNRFVVLRVWDVLLHEGNRNMLFRTGLALMEIHGRVGRSMSKHLNRVCSLFLEEGLIVYSVQRVDGTLLLACLSH